MVGFLRFRRLLSHSHCCMPLMIAEAIRNHVEGPHNEHPPHAQDDEQPARHRGLMTIPTPMYQGDSTTAGGSVSGDTEDSASQSSEACSSVNGIIIAGTEGNPLHGIPLPPTDNESAGIATTGTTAGDQQPTATVGSSGRCLSTEPPELEEMSMMQGGLTRGSRTEEPQSPLRLTDIIPCAECINRFGLWRFAGTTPITLQNNMCHLTVPGSATTPRCGAERPLPQPPQAESHRSDHRRGPTHLRAQS